MEELRSSDPTQIGRYRLVRRLGSGGMGQVYLGQKGGELAAIKVMHRHLAAEPDIAARFRREIQAARRVRGKHTANILDADPDGSPPWLASEYIPGLSLTDTLVKNGPLSESQLRRLTLDLCDALETIHRAKLVHRDLKPSNIVMGPDGAVVIDFGIAYALGQTSLTSTSNFFVSVGYASPEHLDGDTVTPASDIFSLGAVLAFAASGQGPFYRSTPLAIAMAIHQDEPDVDDVPAKLRSLVQDCLAKEPDDRPTINEIRQLLAGKKLNRPVPATLTPTLKNTQKLTRVAPRPTRPVVPPNRPPTVRQPLPKPKPPRKRRRFRLFKFIAGLGVLWALVSFAQNGFAFPSWLTGPSGPTVTTPTYHAKVPTHKPAKRPTHSSTPAAVVSTEPSTEPTTESPSPSDSPSPSTEPTDSPTSEPPSTPNAPSLPTDVSLQCAVDACSGEGDLPADAVISLNVTGITPDQYRQLCRAGFHDDWIDNHDRDLTPSGNCSKYAGPTADALHGADIKPAGPGPWTVTWRLITPSGKVALSSNYRAKVSPA